MRLSTTTALLALPAATLAVTLSDFKSNSDTLKEADLPTDCAKVYKSNISGCQGSDFTGGTGCSEGCVHAMEEMTAKVQSACGSEKLDGTSIITVFLAGGGPHAVCPNSSSQSSAPQTTKAASTSSMTKLSSTASETASTSITLSNTTATMTSPSTTSATTILSVDTSTAATPTRTQSSSQSGANDHNGQGSPFDTPTNYSGAATASSFCLTTIALTCAALFGAALR